MKKLSLIFVLLAAVFAISSCEKHDMVYVEASAPTCTEQGWSDYYRCAHEGCGYTEGYESVEATGHLLSVVPELAHTCTDAGHTEHYVCTREGCGYIEGYEIVPAAGHDLVNYPEKQATVKEDGHTAYTQCSVCGLREGYEKTVKGHELVYVEEKKPTCINAGHSAYCYCTDEGCGYIDGYEMYFSLGHKYVNVPEKAPTRTEDGYTEHQECSVCHLKNAFKTTKYVYSIEGFLPDIEDRMLIRDLQKEDIELIKDMYNSVMLFEEEYVFDENIKVEDAERCIVLLLSCCPELMQINNYTYFYRGNVVTSVKYKYVLEKTQYFSAMDEIKSIVSDVLDDTKGKSEFETEKYVYDYLIDTCTYDNGAPNKTNSYGALVDGRVNCQGYARSFSMFMQAAGIDCVDVYGDTSRGYHEWNIIELDGKNYYVDLTWDDTDSDNIIVLYGYFNVDLETMKNTSHELEDYFKDIVPECASMEMSLAYINGTYISADEDVISKLREIVESCVRKRAMEIYVRTETDEQFEILKNNAANEMSGYLMENEYSYRYYYGYEEDTYSFGMIFERLA